MKFLSVFLCGFIILCLSGCDRDVKMPEEITSETTEVEIDENLLEYYLLEYENAERINDYVGMNRAKKMLGDEKFDYSHGGNFASYDYNCENEGGNLISGNVYIIKPPSPYTKEKGDKIADSQSIEDNDYIVLDCREINNPCMQVRNSYRANSDSVRQEIIDILLYHEESYPTFWQRSKESMDNEWYVHNAAYEIGYMEERAVHVDFDNEDEEKYTELKSAE